MHHPSRQASVGITDFSHCQLSALKYVGNLGKPSRSSSKHVDRGEALQALPTACENWLIIRSINGFNGVRMEKKKSTRCHFLEFPGE